MRTGDGGRGGTAIGGDVPLFLSREWADRVRAAVDGVPDPGVRAEKLSKYWNWIERARSDYSATWVLGVRGPHPESGAGAGDRADLVLEWAEGRCVRAEVVAARGAAPRAGDSAASADPGEPNASAAPDSPVDAADYVLSADYAAWRSLIAGEEPGRLLMYRRMLLERGDVLQFFRRVYLFVESLAALARVPVRLP